MINKKYGDLFSRPHQAYAHGVSTQGKMHAGIAIQFRRNYPALYKEYALLCREGKLAPGDVFYSEKDNVFNLVTQDTLDYALPEYLDSAVLKMHELAKLHMITDIAMPEIGCGIGQLSRKQLYSALRPFANSEMQVTVYRLMLQHT